MASPDASSATGSATGVANGEVGVEALHAHLQGVREVGDGAFIEGLQRYVLAVGAAIERGDSVGALDLVTALLGALSG